jgi:DNA gyrase subunit A
MAPHNLVEVIGAARHLISNPTCSLDDLMKFVPGPTCRAAARSSAWRESAMRTSPGVGSSARGRRPGSRTSPRAARASSSPSCPTSSAREGHREDQGPGPVQEAQGISDVKDLTDRKHGLQLVIEIKDGFHPRRCWSSSSS